MRVWLSGGWVWDEGVVCKDDSPRWNEGVVECAVKAVVWYVCG